MGKFSVRDARRSEGKARILISSPAGGGKTFGALTLAKGMGAKRIVLIDTERKSSDKYQGAPGIPEFRVIEFDPPYTPENYCDAIEAAEQDGADVIIVDSTSHEWIGKGGCLELVDEIARAKYRGNSWSAWSEITPRHRGFIDRMLASTAHIIATGRAKTETAQVDDQGRKRVVKLGMKTEQRDGIEYEFDIVLDVVHDGHFAVASKDRTGIFAGGDPKPITTETGALLAAWFSGGEPAAKPRYKTPPPGVNVDEVLALISVSALAPLVGLEAKVVKRFAAGEITADQRDLIRAAIEARRNQLDAAEVGA
jgi:hypothetical protein